VSKEDPHKDLYAYTDSMSLDLKLDFDTSYPREVIIGDQVWMTRNLNTDTFQNGDTIFKAETDEEWIEASQKKIPAWCYYENDSRYGLIYGRLYNWYAVKDKRGLAPKGWKIPSYYDWNILLDELGRETGIKLKADFDWKSDMRTHPCFNCRSWNEEYRAKVPCHDCRDTREITVGNVGEFGNNAFGFTGLPAGYRYITEDECNFSGLKHKTYFWLSSANPPNYPPNDRIAVAYDLDINFDFCSISLSPRSDGYSVRCFRSIK
jgi:uncharacterized protein (TIGR02145 family)